MAATRHIGIVGGGIAGSLAALVLRSRSPSASITVLDAGRRGVGGRLAGGRHPDSGASFMRCTAAADAAHLRQVLSQLESAGILARWDARFGLLGSAGGGFLPRDVVAKTAVGQMMKQDAPGASNQGVDFCGLLGGGDAPFYVGMPNNAAICERICKLAGAEVFSNATRCPSSNTTTPRLQLNHAHLTRALLFAGASGRDCGVGAAPGRARRLGGARAPPWRSRDPCRCRLECAGGSARV